MLEITKTNGETTSMALCDECGNGYSWSVNISFSKMEWILREKHGWKTGKRHICEKCEAAALLRAEKLTRKETE